MNLSSIVIAKNEESSIKKCIESQLNCIDDIVVLIDKESKDRTQQIAESYPKVNYEVVEWRGYSGTKIYALSKTLNNWVLWIDADEAITAELKEELIQFKMTTPPNAAYTVPRRAYFLGKWIKHSGWYPGRVIRLFDKGRGGFSRNQVHEHLIINGPIGHLKADLEHYTDPEIKHYFNKFNKYTSLAAQELADKNYSFSFIDILVRPIFIFFKMYIIKLGFLDGFHGFILAVFSALYVFTKYCKLWEINNK